MKKIIALVCAMVMLLLPLTVLAQDKKDTTIMYVNTGNSGMLNVRKSTHTHSNNVVIKLENGTEVKVESYNSNQTWVKIEVKVNKKVYEGYVMNRYLSATKPVIKPTAKPAATATPAPAAALNFKNFKHTESTRMTVKPATPGGFVNLRWAPSKSVAVMTKLYADAQVIVIAKDKTWAQVYEPNTGYVGFVMLSFLK